VHVLGCPSRICIRLFSHCRGVCKQCTRWLLCMWWYVQHNLEPSVPGCAVFWVNTGEGDCPCSCSLKLWLCFEGLGHTVGFCTGCSVEAVVSCGHQLDLWFQHHSAKATTSQPRPSCCNSCVTVVHRVTAKTCVLFGQPHSPPLPASSPVLTHPCHAQSVACPPVTLLLLPPPPRDHRLS
jgi:hypothetical protein